jgi:hypothetical protein
MKSLKTAVLRALLFSAFSISLGESIHASDGVTITPLENSSKAVVTILPNGSKSTYLTLENESQLYYSTNINTAQAFSKVFDFSMLPDGTYYLTVTQGTKVVKKQINVTNSGIYTDLSYSCSEPNFVLTGTLLQVSDLCPANYSNYVSISNDKETVFSESVSDKKSNRVYDISHLPKGEYTASVSNNYQTYKYSFELK